MSGNKGNFVRPPSRGGIKDPRNATFVVKLADLEKQREHEGRRGNRMTSKTVQPSRPYQCQPRSLR